MSFTAWLDPGALGFDRFCWLSAACLLAYFLKGFSGFGPALVLVPSVSALFDPKTALAVSAFVDLFVGLALIRVLAYQRGDLRLVARLAACMALGSVAGASLAGAVSAALLARIITVTVFCFGSSLVLFHRTVPVRALRTGSWALDLGCVLGGLSGGLVGISGPFVVLFARPLMDKGEFRRVLVALFLLEGVVKLAAYAVVGVWTPITPTVSVAAAPAVAAGLALGLRGHAKVDERAFSVVVGVILVALSVRLFVS